MNMPEQDTTTVAGTQPLTVHQLQALHADLHPARVAKRSQNGMQLSYLEAHDVRAMLIRAFGYGGFSAECMDAKIIREDRVQSQSRSDTTNWKITAQATVRVRIHQTGATYTETAIAGSTQPDFTEAADMAVKSAESDALKRACINLGAQFGLSLYSAGSTRDTVRRVFAPGQREILDDLALSRDPGQEGQAARQRLQQHLKVHDDPQTRALTNADEAAQPAEPPAEPAVAPEPAPTTTRPSRARQAAARAALAEAEAKVGMGQQ